MELEKIKELAEKKADEQERRGTSAWQGVYHGFIFGYQASELNTKALHLRGVVFSDDECKHKATCGHDICNLSECDEYEKAEVCPLCNNTGEYHFGGSFGGSVQIRKCNCGQT